MKIFISLFIITFLFCGCELKEKQFAKAVKESNWTKIEKLINSGVNINSDIEDGRTALILASFNNNADMVKIMISAKADVNVQDKYGWTSLMYAYRNGNRNIVDMLLDSGADVNMQDQYGKTALMLACEKENKDRVNAILEAGADINVKDYAGSTVLMKACELNNLELVNIFINAGADVNVHDKKGKTALMIACSKGNKSIIKALKKTDADNKEVLEFFSKYYRDNYGLKMVQIAGRNYEMLETEVTQKMYKKIMGSNPSNFHGDNYPVESVTWFEAAEFCNKLSQEMYLTPAYLINHGVVKLNESGDGFRLPTVEEWQYAKKGGEDYKYAGSNNKDEVAWYYNNSDGQTHPVARKKANGYGLYDMVGNVQEWCWDSSWGDKDSRETCGENWYSGYAQDAYSIGYETGYWLWRPADSRDERLGFRIVRTKE